MSEHGLKKVEEYGKLKNEGNELVKLKKYEEAIVKFSECLEVKKDDEVTFLNRGSMFAEIGDYEKALADYSRAIELKSDYLKAILNRGVVYNDLGNPTKAIQEFSRAIFLKKDYGLAYLNRGTTLDQHGMYTDAIRDYTKAIELLEINTHIYCNRGSTHSRVANYSEAIRDYSAAIESKVDYVDAYVGRGVVYIKQKDYEKAVRDFSKAIELKADYMGAFYNRGNALKKLKRYDEALKDFSNVIKLKSDFVEAYYNRGVLLLHVFGKSAEAIQDFSKAIQLKKDHGEAYYNRGIAFVHIGKYVKAIRDYTKAIKWKKDLVNVYYNRGYVYDHLKKYSKAIRDYKKAIKLKKNFQTAKTHLAISCKKETLRIVKKIFKIFYVHGEVSIKGNTVNGRAEIFYRTKQVLFGKQKTVKLFDGYFLDGRFNGEGILFDKTSRKPKVLYKGIWENGYFCKRIVEVQSFAKSFKTIKILGNNPLGHGTFSYVYKVNFEGREMAYKRFNDKYQTFRYCETFVKVLENSYQLHHRNINIPYAHSLNFKDRRMGFLSELGKISIEELIQKSREKKIRFPFSTKLEILLGVSEGMKYLHHPKINIIHRDLKWENIMLFNDEKDFLKVGIIDFGESKELKRKTNTYRTGTKWFLAPEVLEEVERGKAHYTQKADVFSFGIMLFTLYFDVLSTTRNEKNEFELEKLFFRSNLAFLQNLGLRPKIDKDKVRKGEDWIIALMKECWNNDTKKRPQFSEIVDILHSELSVQRKEHVSITMFYEQLNGVA